MKYEYDYIDCGDTVASLTMLNKKGREGFKVFHVQHLELFDAFWLIKEVHDCETCNKDE